jgi:universal stress protein A
MKSRTSRTITLPNAGNTRLKANAAKPAPAQDEALAIQRILAPVDFSACSKKAIRYATTLARHFESEVLLLHIVKPITPALSPDLVVLDPDPNSIQFQQAAEEKLAQWQSAHAPGGRVKAMVRGGYSIEQEIVDAARENKADLIVIGTHEKTTLEHLFGGSVAAHVVRHAPCPVLVLREHERDFVPAKSGAATKVKSANSGAKVSRRRE